MRPTPTPMATATTPARRRWPSRPARSCAARSTRPRHEGSRPWPPPSWSTTSTARRTGTRRPTRHLGYKQGLKEVPDRLGASVTFMAKVATDQAGSSCHVHMSLWRDGDNAFAGDDQLGPVRCSDEFRWFLGGVLARVPDVMVFLAPTVNSYKRYVDGSWAPTRIAWSYDNRTAGVRVVGRGPSLRVECRIPGADCNPYLALAALLASGLDGIANRTEPSPCFEGDVYAARDLPQVPRSLAEATDLFVASPFAKAAFGQQVVDHYAHFFRTEWEAYTSAVSDWERRRYFERI